jgi:hypothetical protein
MTDLALEAEHDRSAMQGFDAALPREILITERLRIKAVLLDETCSDAVPLGAVPVKGCDQPQTVWKLG